MSDRPRAELRRIVATRADAGVRLDHVLRRHLADLGHATRTKVQHWIREGAVSVNGRSVARPAARAASGDRIDVAVPPGRARRRMSAEAPGLGVLDALDVLFEDEHLLAVNKPAGVVVHPTYRHPTGTLMNALLWRARHWPEGQRPSLVGRLDRLTSGIVLVARTARVHAALQRTLAHAVSEKSYLALVFGRVPASRGVIDLALARDLRDRRRVVAAVTGGLPSVTRFERLARSQAARSGLALLRCRLVTGRMHQIRAHLAARGWPIVGDPVYGEPRWEQIADADLAAALHGFPRQALHAWRLAFPHPITGAPVQVHAPVPGDFARLLRTADLPVPEP